MSKNLRRYQNTLAISGLGVIALSIWSAIKDLLFIVLNTEQVRAAMVAYGGEPDASLVGMIIGTAFFLVIFLAISIFVGLSAYREGTGVRRGRVYIVLGALMFLSLVVALFTDFTSLIASFQGGEFAASDDTHASSMLIDLTALFAMGELLLSAVRVKRARRNVPKMEA